METECILWDARLFFKQNSPHWPNSNLYRTNCNLAMVIFRASILPVDLIDMIQQFCFLLGKEFRMNIALISQRIQQLP